VTAEDSADFVAPAERVAGDIPMMRFARTGDHAALRLLVLHDDADREFAHTAGAEDALDRAKARGWAIGASRTTGKPFR
jgi:hypothetical protein